MGARAAALLLLVGVGAGCQPEPRPPALVARSHPASAPAPAPTLGHRSGAPARLVPPDFWVKYSRRGGEPGKWQIAEIAGPDCPRNCIALRPDEQRRLYAAFERHAFMQMRTHSINASPHRGGVCLEARWRGKTHSICDVTTSEVEESWRAAFDALARETLDIFLGAQARGGP